MNIETSNVAETANFQSHTFVFGKRVRLSDIRSLNYFVFVTLSKKHFTIKDVDVFYIFVS